MKSENSKIEKRVLNYFERAYEMTISDINRYIRQVGSITVEVIKRLIRWNYFENKDAVDLYAHYDDGDTIITVDMFDLQLWLIEKYGIEDIDIMDDIEDKLNDLTTIRATTI